YYGTNLLAVDGHIYQFLATFNRIYNVTDTYSATDPFIMTNAKLIHSPDNGRTWCNQDGTTPVVRESQHEQSRSTMTFFFDKPKGAFSNLSFLQMGKDYQDNHDGYVYVYSPNGATEGTMNQLVLFRVVKTKILDRGAYEYFAQLRADGDAHWVTDINAR